ncbi:MAG TPA: DUF2461 domain-containing protein [Acidimicrobiales bacterium]|nr:DUF2461 domain-containing protein [Acidimicrobiales bacterium]
MAFRGWPAEAVEFYEGLEADNSKSYWTANKSTYETKVLGPMNELLAELADEFGPGRPFRPYRDIRFSADKSPYKTYLAAHLEGGGYISFSSAGLGVGCGLYMPGPEALARFRAAIDDDATGAELVALVGALRKKGMQVSAHEELKTAPKGYAKDHPRIDLLRMKGVTTWQQWPPGPWLGTARARDRVAKHLRDSRPLLDWLAANVGELAPAEA